MITEGDHHAHHNRSDTSDRPGGTSLDTSAHYEGIVRLPKTHDDAESPLSTAVEVQRRLGFFQGLATAAKRGEAVDVLLSGDGTKSQLHIRGSMFSPNSEPTTPSEDRTLVQPAEARGVRTEEAKVQEIEAQYPFWKTLSATPGTWLAADKEATGINPTMPLVRDVLSSHAGRPYALAMKAQAIPPEQIDKLARDLSNQIAAAKLREDDEPEIADRRKRLEERHGTVLRGKESGLWDWRFIVGGQTETDVDELARKIESAAHDPALNYSFSSLEGISPSKEDAMAATDTTPILVGTDLIRHTAPIPRESTDLPGIPTYERPHFSTNILNALDIPDERKVITGTIPDSYDNPGVPLIEDRNAAVQHELVTGASGTRKTTYVTRRILEMVKSGEEAGEPVGVLVITPKPTDDYLDIGEHLPEGRSLISLTPGSLDDARVGIDPTRRFPGETPRQAAARLVFSTINAQAASGHIDPEASRIVGQYFTEGTRGYNWGGTKVAGLYEKAGIDPHLGTSRYAGDTPPDPTFADAIDEAIVVTKGHKYTHQAEKLPEFVGSSLGVILQSGEYFFKGEQIDKDKLRHGFTVLNTSEMNDRIAQSLTVTTTLEYMIATMKEEYKEKGKPEHTKFVVVIEEASLLAQKGSPTEALLVDMAERARAVGIALVFVSQEHRTVADGIVGNATTKVAFRPEGNEKDVIAEDYGITDPEQKAYFAKMQNGRALYKSDGSGDAVLVDLLPPLDRSGALHYIGPEALVADGKDAPTLKETIDAENFIEHTTEGKIVQFWAEMEMISELIGEATFEPDAEGMRNKPETLYPFLDRIRSFGPTQKRALEIALRNEVTRAFDDRKKFALKERNRQDTIDKVTARLAFHIDNNDPENPLQLPEELEPGPPLAGFTELKEKAKAQLYIDVNMDIVASRQVTAQIIANAEHYLSLPQYEGNQEIQAELAMYRATAAEQDAQLTRLNAITYDPATGEITHHPDHPHYVALGKPHASLVDVLIPPRLGGYTLDRATGDDTTIDKAIGDGKIEQWQQRIEGLLEYFKLPLTTQALLKAEFGGTLKKYKEKKDAELAKEKNAQPTITDAQVGKTEISQPQPPSNPEVALLAQQVQGLQQLIVEFITREKQPTEIIDNRTEEEKNRGYL